jgi:hydrogenase nickel incorporation protein HypB
MHVIGIEKDIMEINMKIAERNRELFEENGVFAFNIMGAIGSGKTSLIEALYEKLKDFRMGVIAGDVISDVDAKRLDKLAVPVVGINTGKECHLDAHLIQHSLEKIPLNRIDLLFIENVGNLICPVDFALGAQKRITMVSVSEGDDTVEKHPMIFLSSDAAVINKIDIAGFVGADAGKMRDDAFRINPKLRVFMTSIKTGEGIPELTEWIRNEKQKG